MLLVAHFFQPGVMVYPGRQQVWSADDWFFPHVSSRERYKIRRYIVMRGKINEAQVLVGSGL